MNKFTFKDYFVEPSGKISKRMIYKSDNVIAFVLNIAAGQTLPAHTHFDSTLLFQIMNGEAKVFTNGNETLLSTGELMQIDGKESVQVENIGNSTLQLFVTISPIGSESFATDADI